MRSSAKGASPRRIVLVLLWLGSAAAPLTEQTQQATDRTTLDGVYTAEQAGRGEQVYANRCASCHRSDLSGLSAPPLQGQLFMDRWREFNLDVLFRLIESQMPLDSPMGLSKSSYLNVTAFLLRANGLPSGPRELTADALAATRLVGIGGPQPLPTSTPVAVVGCIAKEPGFGWFLTAATEPARTLDAFAVAGAETAEAEDMSLGRLTLRLQNLEDLTGRSTEAMAGAKVLAKGILVRQKAGSRLNVTALRQLGAPCDSLLANGKSN